MRRARELKGQRPNDALAGKNVALLFEKPSLRTRASFQVAIQQLGGYSLYMGGEEVGLGVREPVADVARVLSGYVDCIVARVYSHSHLQELAEYATVPVINALSDWEHPCQTLADLLTIDEHLGKLQGVKLAFIGDGNNVARSLCLALTPLEARFAIAAPEQYGLDSESLDLARSRGPGGEGEVLALREPQEAVQGADVVYTDVWASMGQEEETAQRLRSFQGYTVDPELLGQRQARSPVYARYARPLRPGGAGGDAGAPPVRRLSPGSQQAACPEGIARVHPGLTIQTNPETRFGSSHCRHHRTAQRR